MPYNATSNILFRDIFPDYNTFNSNFIEPLLTAYTRTRNSESVIIAEWLDETKLFSDFQLLFYHLANYFNDREIRYNLDQFLANMSNIFSDASFDIYFKQKAFYNKEIGDYIQDLKNRDKKDDGINNSTYTENNVESPEPFNSNSGPIDNSDNAAKKNQTTNTAENSNSNEQYHAIDDFKNLIAYRYKIGLDEFISAFNPLFRNFIGIAIRPKLFGNSY